jgi:hypothetical protein
VPRQLVLRGRHFAQHLRARARAGGARLSTIDRANERARACVRARVLTWRWLWMDSRMPSCTCGRAGGRE